MNAPKLNPATIQEGIDLAELLAYDQELIRHHRDLTDVAFSLSGALGCFEQINDNVTFIADPLNLGECLLDALHALESHADRLRNED